MSSDHSPDRPTEQDVPPGFWSRHRTRVVRTLAPLGGFTILGLLVWRVGPTEIYSQILGVGWWFLPVLTLSCLWKISNTCAWILAFRPSVELPSFFRMFCVNVSGDVLNNTLPTNMGGELSKPFLLRAYVPADARTRAKDSPAAARGGAAAARWSARRVGPPLAHPPPAAGAGRPPPPRRVPRGP